MTKKRREYLDNMLGNAAAINDRNDSRRRDKLNKALDDANEYNKTKQEAARTTISAQDYARSRVVYTSPNRRNLAARTEFNNDTDKLIDARKKADNKAYVGSDDYAAMFAPKKNKQATAEYNNLAEEYKKKYNISSDKEFENTLRNRENAVKSAEERKPYDRYKSLDDEGKTLVKQAYGDTKYEPTISDNASGQVANNIISKSNARNEAKNQLKEKYGFTDDDLKDLKRGYKDSKKYGTSITEDENLKAKYDSLDGVGRQLVRDAYNNVDKQVKTDPYAEMFMPDKPEEVRDTHARERLKSEYHLTDAEITQLSIYAKRAEDARMGNAEFAKQVGKDAAKDLTGVASIASVGGNVIGAVTSPIGIARDLAENAALERAGYKGDLTLNKDNPWYIPQRATKAIREQRGEDLDTYWNEKLGTDNHVASFVYQTAMSGADSLVAARIGSLFPTVDFGGTINGARNIVSMGKGVTDAAYSMGVGGLMLGAGAGDDTMLDLADKGASAQTAVTGGLVAATTEMLFEDLSISQLDTFKGVEALKMAKGFSRDAVKKNIGIAAKKILGSVVTNASEEGLTEIANLIYDTLANGDMSQYAEYYNNAIANGATTDEARKAAFKQMTLQVLEAAAGGALMGGAFGVGGAAKLNAQRNTTYESAPDVVTRVGSPKAEGREISNAGRTTEALRAADAMGGQAQDYKNRVVRRAGGEANLSEKQIGKIALETLYATEGNKEAQENLDSFYRQEEEKRKAYKQDFNKEAHYAVTNSPIRIDGKETYIVNKNVNKEGKTADIFRKGKNGLEFETSDGRTVTLNKQSVNSIQNADARQLAKSALDNNLGAESANLLFDTYDGEYTPSDHARAFMRLYRQGALGTSAKNIVSLYGDDRSKFTADKTQEILNLGLKEKPLTVGATNWTTGKVSWFAKQQMDIIDSVVKSLAEKNPQRAKEVIFVDDMMESYKDSEGNEKFRFFNGTAVGENRILLSMKSDWGLLLSFFAHEMGHQMKKENKAAYDNIAEFVKSRYKGDEYQKTLDEFVRKGYDPEEAKEELICNSLFEVFDQKTVKQIVGKDYKFAYKMLDIASALVQEYDKRLDQFANATRDGAALHSDIKKLREDRDMVEEIRERFLEYVNSEPRSGEEIESTSPENESQENFSIADRETSDRLDKEEYVTTYRAMALIDGKLYPPMATYMGQKKSEMKLVDGAEINDWITSDEFPEYVKDGKFPLNKEVWNDKKGKWEMKTIWAAYNPYMHSSNVVLNDQFSSAYKRPNIVTVECRVPVSELTSGYWADQAKDPTGWHDWKAGKVAGKIAQQKDFKRQVLLSRWVKPVRIVPDAEVASLYKEYLKDTDVTVPDNVVTPGLLKELQKIGVPITESGLLSRDADYVKEVNKELSKSGVAVDAKTGSAYSIRYNKLTAEQESFFKNSKIRDENGNLLVVYHGTDADFTVFDKTKGRSTMDIQGSFFSPWEIDAGGYGKSVGKYYLNITNPAPEDVAYRVLNMYKGKNNAGVKAREYLEKLGYDGVNNGNEEYIAFDSNQIKRVDNFNPTKSKDVRYAIREDLDKAIADAKSDDEKEYLANLKEYLDAGTRRNISKIEALLKGKEIILGLDEIKDYIADAIKQKEGLVSTAFGKVTEQMSSDIKTVNKDVDVKDYYLEFVPNDLHHAYKEHKLPKEEGNIALTDEDFENIPEYLSTYDRVLSVIKYRKSGNVRAIFSKKTPKGHIIIIETVSGSRGALALKTIYGVTDEKFREVLSSIYKNSKPSSRVSKSSIIPLRNGLAVQLDSSTIFKKSQELNSNSISDRTEETEFDDFVESASDEEIRSLVDNVDKELLGDAMGYGRMLGEQKRKTEQKVKEQRRKDVAYYQQRMKEIREDRDQKILALKALRYQRDVERREFAKRRDYRAKIIRKYDRLQKMTTNPTEKQHVPAELMHSIAGFLGEITPNLLQEQTRKDGTIIKKREQNNTRLMDLVAAYKAIQNDYEDVYDPEVANLLDEASTAFGSKYLDEMDSYELADVNNLMSAIEHTIRRANKAFVEGKERDAFALTKNLIRQSEEGKKSRFNRAKQIVWSQLNPYSFFHAMSNYEDGGWMDIYKILNEGQLRKTRIQTDVVDAFKELMINGELDKLSDYKNGLVDVGLVGADNQPIKITRGLMLSLYLHLQNEQNRKHIAEGGLTLPNYEAYYKNKINAWGNETVRTLAINGDLFRLHTEQNRLRELKRNSDSDEIRARYDEDIAELESQMEELRGDADRLMDDISLRIESELTDYERKFIDKAKWFFNEYSKEKLNEATMRMYGFKKAREENYMPIISDPDFLKTEFETVTRDASLENMGFMKDRQKGANNAIKLFDLTDVINAQLNKVSKFAGLAPSIKEFNRVYNKSLFNDNGGKASAKEAAKQRFDTFGENYIENLLADLQGGRKAKGSTDVFAKLRGASYQAALMLNLRVAMAQAGSYPTAAAEVGWKPLMKALAKGGKDGKVISRADRELIDTYTPLLANRFVGGASTDITNVSRNNKHTIRGLENRALQHTRALTDWISMMDTATVGRLWSAAEYYVDENFDLEKGSEGEIKSGESEYYKKVAEVFNRIVERTQPSYTTMQRPELLRNPNEMLKMFTMFMTQRAQNFNLVYDAAATFAKENEKRKSGVYDAATYDEARRTLARTALSQAVAGVTLATFKAIADAIQHNMKGYKDDDDEITILSVLQRLLKTFAESEVSNMLGGSELFSFVESAVTGSPYYGITANVAGTIEDMSTAISSLIKNGVNEKTLTKVATSTGMIIGIPAAQMKKWVDMFKGWYGDIKDGGEIYSNITGSSSAKSTTEKMVKKYLSGDMDEYRKIRESLKGENASTVKTNITSYLREQYVDGKLDDGEVRRVLTYVYGMSNTNINKKLEEFRQRKNGTYEKKESKKWGEE